MQSECRQPWSVTINDRVQSVPLPGEDTYMKRLGMLVIALMGILTSIWPQTFCMGVFLLGSFTKVWGRQMNHKCFKQHVCSIICLFHLCWSCRRFVLLFNALVYSFSSSFSFHIVSLGESLVMHILSEGYKKLFKIFFMCLCNFSSLVLLEKLFPAA